MPPSREAELQELLLDAFTNEELVQLLRADEATKAIVRSLPSPSSPPASFALEVVLALQRRGLIDPFLVAVYRARPNLAPAPTPVPPRPPGPGGGFFLLHASADKPAAEALYRLLAPKASVFLDSRSIPLGAVWPEVLRRALAESRVVVVLASERTHAGHYALDEIATAIAEARRGEKTIVPVWLDGRRVDVYGLGIYQGLLVDARGLEPVARALLELV